MSDQKRSTIISPSCLHKLFFSIILFLALFVLSGCDQACAATVEAFTWNDGNTNGIQDSGELPIGNVAVDYIVDYGASRTFGIWSAFIVSDGKGRATLLEQSLGSCPHSVSGKVRPLNGYELTTPGVFTVTLSRTTTDTVTLGFGFANDLQATPTPKPTGHVDCYSISFLGYGGITDVEFMPNGDVWVARAGPRNALSLIQGDKEFYREELSNFSDAYDLAQAPDQTLWVAGGGHSGIAHYDGVSWQQYSRENGLPFGGSNTIKVTPNGHAWIVGEGKVAEFDPLNGTWSEHSELGNGIWLQQAVNGDLWLVNNQPLALTGFSYSDPAGSVRKIEFKDLNLDMFEVNSATITRDESLWMGGHFTNGEPLLIRYRAETAQWTTFTYTSTLGAMPANGIVGLTALPDNSVFIGTYRDGGHRYMPDSTDSPIGGQWIEYPNIAAEVDAALYRRNIDLPPSLDGFAWISVYTETGGGYPRICKVK